MKRLAGFIRARWARSFVGEWNERQAERGYTAAVVPLPSYRKSLKHLARKVWEDGRWELALFIAPEIREELELR